MTSPTHGLLWHIAQYDTELLWTVEPDIDAVEGIFREVLAIPGSEQCTVSFLAEGSHTKVYKAETGVGDFVLKVCLPLDPISIYSEVSTIEHVQANTTIPIPEIITFTPDNDNDLHFPWILMRMAPGVCLGSAWRGMTLKRKRNIITQIARIQTQLSRHTFSSIGSLSTPESEQHIVSRIACEKFHLPLHASASTLGPHDNSHDWLRERLRQILFRLDHNIRPLPDEAEEDYGNYELDRNRDVWRRHQVEAVLSYLSTSSTFPRSPETTSIFHADLHPDNIYIDENDTITAILGWGFLTTVPDWASHEFPDLIRSPKRQYKPDRELYRDLTAETGTPESEPSEGYWRDLTAYHATRLRPFYLAEMDRLTPGWSERYQATKFHRLLEHQVTCLEAEHREVECRNVRGWMEAYEGDGKVPRDESKKWPCALEDTEVWVDEEYEDSESDDECDGGGFGDGMVFGGAEGSLGVGSAVDTVKSFLRFYFALQ